MPPILNNRINKLTTIYLKAWGAIGLSAFSNAQYLRTVKLTIAPRADANPAEMT